MSERIVVISDTHLGRPRCAAKSAEALRPLWTDADHFIINGDVAEVHHPEHWTDAARATLRLFDLCDADDVQLTLLSGNHDPYLSPHRYLHVENDRIFVTHGDALHPAVAPWSPQAGRIREAHDEALATLDPDKRSDLESRLSITKEISHQQWSTLRRQAESSVMWRMFISPWAISKVLWYWRTFPGLGAQFGMDHAPNARFLLFGHTHRPGVWHRNGRTIINTGSFGFPGRPRAVVIANGTLRVWPIVCRDGVYRYGTRSIAEFSLDETPRAGQPDPASVLNTRPGSALRSALRM